MARLILGVAVLVSLSAVWLALYGSGGGILGPIPEFLPIVLGAIAVLLGLVTFCLGLGAQRGIAFLEAAAVAIFLGISVLGFSIGSMRIASEIRQYREIAAKADEVEAARREVVRLKSDAENTLQKVTEEPNKILKAANDAKQKNEELSDKLKMEQAGLNKNRDFLTGRHAKVDQQEADLADKRKSIKDQESMLAQHQQDLKKQTDQLLLDLKKPQELNDEAVKLRSDAEEKLRAATAANFVLEKKEKEVKAYYKDVVDKLKNTLKSKTKVAINAVEQVGALAKPADLELGEITYDLCDIAVKNKELRQDAFDAIFRFDRGLGEAATFMIKPPADGVFKEWVRTINELEKYGPGGLPLIEGLLTRTTLKQLNANYAYWHMYAASIAVLGKLAKEDERALVMLTKAPKWSYAKYLEDKAFVHNLWYIMNIENSIPGAPNQLLDPRNTAGVQLFEVCKVHPKARKKEEVIDFFVNLLTETKAAKSVPGSNQVAAKLTEENQLLAVAALASFQSDAKRAIESLRILRSAKSTEVRKAAISALEQIENAK